MTPASPVPARRWCRGRIREGIETASPGLWATPAGAQASQGPSRCCRDWKQAPRGPNQAAGQIPRFRRSPSKGSAPWRGRPGPWRGHPARCSRRRGLNLPFSGAGRNRFSPSEHAPPPCHQACQPSCRGFMAVCRLSMLWSQFCFAFALLSPSRLALWRTAAKSRLSIAHAVD